MTDITIQRIPASSRPGRKPKGVTSKRVTAANGEKVTIRSIEANSPTFGEDLLYVFGRNVAAARRENKALLGTPSGVRKAK
ncbi:MAG: hypothetical protein ACK4JY_07815 [Brevundimonas sp.]|uniref:hypothetical protein n=1 Tax=Brevundimonas sp. TaxID=1871086 RepID=UPI002A9EE450|nr:hypothetical protein [Pseudomonadota bacterium]